MSIGQMLGIGPVTRHCPVCGYPIRAKDNVLTAHELTCLNVPSLDDMYARQGLLVVQPTPIVPTGN